MTQFDSILTIPSLRNDAINNTLGAINSSIGNGDEINVDLSLQMLESISNIEINDVETAENLLNAIGMVYGYTLD
jgi:hypothetical protein